MGIYESSSSIIKENFEQNENIMTKRKINKIQPLEIIETDIKNNILQECIIDKTRGFETIEDIKDLNVYKAVCKIKLEVI